MVRGVRYFRNGGAQTHSLVMRSLTGTVRYIRAIHQLGKMNRLLADSAEAKRLADAAIAQQVRDQELKAGF